MPLALAFATHPGIRAWSILDERAAAFFALGVARATGKPAAALATSGTAGANFLPAVVESTMSRIPLVAVTADRPWELHGFGAPQTVVQEGMFGGFARARVDLPPPEETPGAASHLRALTARALASIRAPNGGAIHLNVPFRDPLVPAGDARAAAPSREAGLEIAAARVDPPPDMLRRLAGELGNVERGLIVCGPRGVDDAFGPAVLRLGRRFGYPILADACSQARFGLDAPGIVGHYDLLLANPAIASGERPSIVLRFGGSPTSKRLQTWLDEARPETVFFSEGGAVFDPSHLARRIIEADPVAICEALAAGAPRNSSWARGWYEAERTARDALDGWFQRENGLTGPNVAREVAALAPESGCLFVSNSLPIRELDAHASPARRSLRVLANRGANGIDGIVSTALGVAAASRRPTWLLIGDLALLHDVGALAIAQRHRIPLTVIVINNRGGGIFSFLPVAEAGPAFEEFFATPHEVDLAELARLFGAQYDEPRSTAELRAVLAAAVEPRFRLIEIQTDRSLAPALSRRIVEHVADAVGIGGLR